MNSRHVLRVIHGTWNLHQNGEWSFERKTNDLGFPAIVRTLPEWMLIPDGNKTPPITILETPDIQFMMAVRAWFADLTLCVTIGAEDVARYQFFCQADFNIGSSSYKFRNGNEDLSFEGFLGEAVVASQAVLEEYFNDQEMMVNHRVHLEMEKAKLDLENQRCYELVHGNEIIVIDDTDSDSDGTEPLGSNKLSITVFNTGVALDSEYISQPNVSNDSPMEYYKGIPVQFTVDEDLVIVQPSVLDDTLVIYNAENMPQNSASVDLIPAANNSPTISATVGLIPNPANGDDNLVINLDDSSLEDSMDSGVF
ncbi:BnaA06g20260D [Brassica napus]|uniref:(rape) hypothetical protein n=1 Tax=Brassica napus TaxID=3708 RepID=A0A078FJP2_BRANA|nr:unnamed protein product [Brassica napus]CDY12318.1 BnaA06g20260D [Brassica napus]